MTPEELDELDDAIVAESIKWCLGEKAGDWGEDRPYPLWQVRRVALGAIRRSREGWTPPGPVDPDLLFVREVAEKAAGFHTKVAQLAGEWDDSDAAKIALAVLRAERERVAKLEPKADAGGWIPHDGKGQPVAGDVRVKVCFRGDQSFWARYLQWDHRGSENDIIAWRLA